MLAFVHHPCIDGVFFPLDLKIQMAAFPNRLHLLSAILKLFVVLFKRLQGKECGATTKTALSPSREPEQHNNLFQYGAVQVVDLGRQPSEHSKSR